MISGCFGPFCTEPKGFLSKPWNPPSTTLPFPSAFTSRISDWWNYSRYQIVGWITSTICSGAICYGIDTHLDIQTGVMLLQNTSIQRMSQNATPLLKVVLSNLRSLQSLVCTLLCQPDFRQSLQWWSHSFVWYWCKGERYAHLYSCCPNRSSWTWHWQSLSPYTLRFRHLQ